MQAQALRTIAWEDGGLAKDQTFAEIQETVQDGQTLIWIDIPDRVAPYTTFLCETFGLSKLVLDAIDDATERAKFVDYTNYCYFIVHGLTYDLKTDTASTPDLDIIFGKNFIITAHLVDFPWLDELREEIINQEASEHERHKRMGFLLYKILDRMVDSYFPVLDDIDSVIDELEDTTITETSNEVQVRLFRIKRSLSQMRRVISPQVEVANSLRARTAHFIPEELSPYLNEVYDHMIRAFEILDSYRDLMSGLLDVYLTTVSNRLNVIMKQMAIIATIFMPITFVTGIFGQNFGHPPQVESDSGYNFWIVLLLMVLITLGQIWYFKRKKWM